MSNCYLDMTWGYQKVITNRWRKDVLVDYLKAIDVLTFYSENRQLSKKLQDLEEINQNNNYILKGKLEEKSEEIKLFKQQMDERDDAYSMLADTVSRLMKEFREIKRSSNQ